MLMVENLGNTFKFFYLNFHIICKIKFFIKKENENMPKKLTQEEFCQKVYDCVGDKYTVIS